MYCPILLGDRRKEFFGSPELDTCSNFRIFPLRPTTGPILWPTISQQKSAFVRLQFAPREIARPRVASKLSKRRLLLRLRLETVPKLSNLLVNLLRQWTKLLRTMFSRRTRRQTSKAAPIKQSSLLNLVSEASFFILSQGGLPLGSFFCILCPDGRFISASPFGKS